jgi:hypothetical protein
MSKHTSIGYSLLASGTDTTTYINTHARQTSIKEAIFIQQFTYLWGECKKTGDREFFIIPANFCRPIGMSIYSFRTIVKKWESIGLIQTFLHGCPMKKWYRLNEDRFMQYICQLEGSNQ